MKKTDRIILESLVENNVFKQSELKVYCDECESLGVSLKKILLDKDIVTEKQILIALSQSYQIDTIALEKIIIDASVIEKVPIKIAWYYKFIPIKLEKNVLSIVSSDVLDVKMCDEIRMHLGFDIKALLSTESEVAEAFKKHYGFASNTIDKIMTKDPIKEGVDSKETEQWIEDLEIESDDPTVSNLVNQIILEAYKKRATDIHIEPYRSRVRFRYRIDGVLVDANLPHDVKHFLAPILSRIKILANLSITEKRLPQDGSAVVKTNEQQLDLRISTMPTPRGESMVIRILPTQVRLLSLSNLGFDDESVKVVRNLIEKPHGIIFITGPTGSGKTTTLYAGLKEINSSTRKIITIEDPVEYEMDGITQVQVNNKVDFTFARGLRSILRHDPDIIMVGEVRDLETAEIAIRTALTGHLVFSTLHTNDAANGITRLVEMGMESYLVASSVEAFIAQRLVRVICPTCKQEEKNVLENIKVKIRKSLKMPSNAPIKIYKGKGCEKCNQTGYYGRIAIYEILQMTDPIRAAILEKPRADYIKAIAMREGMITLRQSGWQTVLKGLTTPDEVLNVSVQDDINENNTTDTFDEKNNRSPIPQKNDNNSPRQTSILKDSLPVKEKDLRFIKVSKKGTWLNKSEIDSRSYPRTNQPVEIRYRLLKRDPEDKNYLLSDGVEYPTQTENLSAAGLRFKSKMMLVMGSILELKIQLGDGHKSIDCLAKICRVEEDSRENLFTIVTYYLDISSAEKVKINKFVESTVTESTSSE